MSDRPKVCLRCGAPGQRAFKGGQLVPVKGLERRRVGGRNRPHHVQEYQHADADFCDRRIPGARRTPTAHTSRDPEERIR